MEWTLWQFELGSVPYNNPDRHVSVDFFNSYLIRGMKGMDLDIGSFRLYGAPKQKVRPPFYANEDHTPYVSSLKFSDFFVWGVAHEAIMSRRTINLSSFKQTVGILYGFPKCQPSLEDIISKQYCRLSYVRTFPALVCWQTRFIEHFEDILEPLMKKGEGLPHDESIAIAAPQLIANFHRLPPSDIYGSGDIWFLSRELANTLKPFMARWRELPIDP